MHNIEHGMKPKEATQKAMKEVGGPVVAIALILAAVFVPVAFAGGITGRLYQQFAITIAISVLFSAFNALTLSPALSAIILKPKKESKGLLQRFFNAFNRGFDKFTLGYTGIAGAVAKKSIRSLIIIGFVVGSVVFMPFADPDDRPPGVVMRVVITFGSVVIVTAAAVCERLLQNAVDLKSENDLTV